jgi:hypothetical protein
MLASPKEVACALAASRLREAKALTLADDHAEVSERWRTWAASFYKTACERIVRLEQAWIKSVCKMRAELMRAQSSRQ